MPDFSHAVNADLQAHPAEAAWRQFHTQNIKSAQIITLYNVRKTQVYKLCGIGPAETNVIAKRCRKRSALVERVIYEKVLPLLPISRLKYYGSTEEDDGSFIWLFLEEAKGTTYSPQLNEHRTLAARWLSSLHTCAANSPKLKSLPNRGPDYYFEQLCIACDEIGEGLSNAVLAPQHIDLLRLLLSHLHLLADQWLRIVQVCSLMPHTLVHGDMAVRNVLVHGQSDDLALLILDWNHGGWGTPAIDLVQSADGSSTVSPDLEVYQRAVAETWPHLSVETLERIADCGALFRLVWAIRWATQSLPFSWVDGEIKDLGRYEKRLRTWMSSAGLTQP